MAYVVARPEGRFEIRESLHTQRGPRARTLVGFGVLNDEVLARAAERAQRPFDATAVLASGRRAGAQITAGSPVAPIDHRPPSADLATPRAGSGKTRNHPAGRFVAASNRMARSLRRTPRTERMSPGEALIDLLGFADAVTASRPARAATPLAFPSLARLTANRGETAGLAHG
jgi:hypothetical protein